MVRPYNVSRVLRSPYHSPVRIDSVEPLGARHVELAFLNLGYAAGVQNFQQQFRTLRRTQTHIVLERADNQDRTYVFMPFNRSWLERYFPRLPHDRFFGTSGEPSDQALLSLAATAAPG